MRLLGFDLNGLWDFAAEGEDHSEENLIELGVHSSIVRLESVDKVHWVGGPQVARAPHGKGAGWGQIGAIENRIFVKNMLAELADGHLGKVHRSALKGFLEDLTRDARSAFFAVPDVASFDEGARDRYLQLLSHTTRLRPTLLWRPMAAVLGWLDAVQFDRAFAPSDGLRIAVLSLMPSGVQLADAKLIRERWDDAVVWVPERDEAGVEVGEAFGGEAVARRAAQVLAGPLGVRPEMALGAANMPWQICVGAAPDFELFRMPNRSWRRISASTPTLSESLGPLPEDFRARLARAEALLIEGPMAQNKNWVDAILRSADVSADMPVQRTAKGLVAQGCLVAARRERVGVPVYYDFLPQLEINALVAGEPRFVELIPKKTRLAGGSTYKGDAPGEFAISKGASRLTFYLFKEDFPRGRKAEVDLPQEAPSIHRINVSVEQSPGQGFAVVRIGSPTFEALSRQPLKLDWSQMELVEETKAEILEALAGERGLAYPERDIAPGHPILWQPNHRDGDLIARMQTYLESPLILNGSINPTGRRTLQELRHRFSRPDNPAFIARRMRLVCTDRGSFRALDSNGDLPSPRGNLSVPAEADGLLDGALVKADRELNQVLSEASLSAGQVQGLVSDLIGFASWCFWRCPPSIGSFLLDVYSEERAFYIHNILLREGVGRIVHTVPQLERYFSAIGEKLAGDGQLTAAEFSAIGRVLSSVDQAAERLPSRTADRILQETFDQIATENRSPRSAAYKRRFKSALRMLAALLRHRRVRPNFLDPGGSAAASALLTALHEAENRNQTFQAAAEGAASRSHGNARNSYLAAARRFSTNTNILNELIDLINREGSDPNIIRKIEEIEEE